MQRATHFVPAQWRASPTLVRTVPFLLFVGLTALQGQFGEASRYWMYAAKTIVGAGLVWTTWPWISEMRWRFSLSALVVGVAVFTIWVGLDGWYPSIDALAKKVVRPLAQPLGLAKWCAAPSSPVTPWNPHREFTEPFAWAFALLRLLGSTFVVPPLEEVFYRSFLYRYFIRPEFWTLPLRHFSWSALLVTSAIFGFAHYEWLPGILCGLLYQGLVLRHDRLGDSMTAHALTNFLLGIWVISRGAWHFW